MRKRFPLSSREPGCAPAWIACTNSCIAAPARFIARALLRYVEPIRLFMNEFVHLTVHSEYSLVDGVVRIPALVAQVERMRMPAVGLTDQSNVFAMVKFYRAAVERGIQPIIGADVWVGESVEDREPSRLTLLCVNATGFGR